MDETETVLLSFLFKYSSLLFWIHRGPLHNPAVSSPPTEGGDYLQKEMESPRSVPSIESSTFRKLKLTSRSLPNELEFRVRRDTYTLATTSGSSKRLLFGQKQIVYSVFFFVVFALVAKGPMSPIYSLMYCVLTVLLHSLGGHSG